MARYPGDQNSTGFLYESGTYATSTGGTLQWLGEVKNFAASDDTKVKYQRYHGTGNRDVAQMISTGQLFAGTTTLEPTDWKTALFALGSCVDTSGTISTHVISALNGGSMAANVSGAENPFYSFSLYNSQKAVGTGNNFNRQYNGAVCNEWVLTIPQGDTLSVDMNWIAQSVTYSSGTQLAPTDPGTRAFISADCKFHLPSGTIVSLMNTATLTVNNNFEAKQYANGSLQIGVPIPGPRDYMFDPGIDASSEWTKTLYDQYFLGGSAFNAALSVDVASNRKAFFTMSGCKLVTLDAPAGLDGVNQQAIGIRPQTMDVAVSDTIVKYNAW